MADYLVLMPPAPFTSSKVAFQPESCDLTPDGRDQLRRLGEALRPVLFARPDANRCPPRLHTILSSKSPGHLLTVRDIDRGGVFVQHGLLHYDPKLQGERAEEAAMAAAGIVYCNVREPEVLIVVVDAPLALRLARHFGKEFHCPYPFDGKEIRSGQAVMLAGTSSYRWSRLPG
jgi:hypothetical protein